MLSDQLELAIRLEVANIISALVLMLKSPVYGSFLQVGAIGQQATDMNKLKDICHHQTRALIDHMMELLKKVEESSSMGF